MNTNRKLGAVLSVFLVLTPLAPAQQSTTYVKPYEPAGFWDRFKRPFMESDVAPVRLANSARLESLIRGGKLYLSLQDAVALALENNLDIELQRYGPEIARASLSRAEAGGLLRGVPPSVQQGPQSAVSQVLGGFGGGAGGGGTGGAFAGGRGGAGGGGDTGGTIITTTGTAFLNLDPVFFASYNAGHQSRPQSNTVTTGLTAIALNSQSHGYGMQKSWLTGTTASLAWNNNVVRSTNPLLDLNPSSAANLQLSVTQRLLQGWGRAVNNRNIRIAKNNLKVTDLQFRTQLLVTVSAISNLYWDLVVFNEDVRVKEKALELAQKLYEDNKKEVEIGTKAPIEIVNAEAQIAARQQDLTSANTALLQQETIIKNALSRTGASSPLIAEARIIPTDRLRIPDTDAIVPINDLYDLAVQKRPDLEQTKINIENAKIGLQGSKSQLLPSLDLTGAMQNNALSGSVNDLTLRGRPVPRNADAFFLGGFGNNLGQLARRNFPDYSVGFQLNIPIRNRSAQADMVIDQLSLRQSELNLQRNLNQLRVDIQNAVIAIQQARARYQASVKQRVLQEQTLDAEQKKYALGASTIFFIIQYQRDLAQAQSNEVAAMGAYVKAKTELERVTGQTLDVNNIDVTEAMAGKVSRPPDPLPREQ